MATSTSLLKLTLVLSIAISLLLQPLHSQLTSSSDIEDDEEYILDTPLTSSSFRSRSRFLRRLFKVKKGAHCNPNSYNICNGVSANNGTSLLNCCKKHCRNTLRDENNCGRCGHKCSFGQHCCNGACIGIAYNVNHCGKCERKCLPGVKCEYGHCGYA